MESLFHFGFELIKIAFLSSFYSFLLFLFLKFLGKWKPESWFENVTKLRRKFLLRSFFLLYFGFFLFMLSHYGNHGLGDSARIPLRHFKAVRQINSNSTYLENDGRDQLGVDNFTFDKNYLYAEVEQEFGEELGQFVVWDLRIDKWIFYKTELEYVNAAKNHNYPLPNKFNNFQKHYSEYWHGLKFFLLP